MLLVDIDSDVDVDLGTSKIDVEAREDESAGVEVVIIVLLTVTDSNVDVGVRGVVLDMELVVVFGNEAETRMLVVGVAEYGTEAVLIVIVEVAFEAPMKTELMSLPAEAIMDSRLVD